MKNTGKKYCTQCGAENTASAKFCQTCGKKLDTPSGKPAAQNKSRPETSSWFNHYMILAATFIVSIVILLFIFSSNRENLYRKLSPVGQKKAEQPDSRFREELRDLNLKLLENPNDYQVNVRIANLYFDSQEFIKAISHYKRALEVKHGDPNVIIDLGVSFFNINQPDSAISYINSALSIHPDHVQGLFNAGIVHYNMGNYDTAIALWTKLIDAHHDTEEAHRAEMFIEQVKKQLNNS